MTDVYLSRFVAPRKLSVDLVRRIVSGGSIDGLEVEQILYKGSKVRVPVETLPVIPTGPPLKKPDPGLEVAIAEWIHGWLREVIVADPLLMKEDSMWSWISCFPLRAYSLRRWCNGGGLGDRPLEGFKGLDHLISNSTIHGQARCASRRLFIAADTSWREKKSYSRLGDYFSDTDLFTAIFERQIFLRPALAGAVVDRYKELEISGAKSGRTAWRWIARCVNLSLGSVVLEALEDEEIKPFVDSVTAVSQSA